MKIAFATKDKQSINDHFGWCTTFAVYDVTPAGFEFIGLRNVPECDPPSLCEINADREDLDKIEKRIELIRDCTILYCNAIGPTAAARVIRNRIHPIKVNSPERINDVLKKFADVLKKPPIWLRKVLERELIPGSM